MQKSFVVINAIMLLLGGTLSYASDFGPSEFFDFQTLTDHREYENWDPTVNTVHTYYRKKTDEHLGCMLIKNDIAKALGYGKFEVIKDGKLIIAFCCPNPRCNAITEMHACAFNNCFYRISGQKKNGMKGRMRWEKVDDKLVIFRKDNGLASWNSLTIETRKLSESAAQDEI